MDTAYEKRLNSMLAAAGFLMAAAEPSLAWAIFRRLLDAPLQDDVGSMVEAYTADESRFSIAFMRQRSSDEEFWQHRLVLSCPADETLLRISFVFDLDRANDGLMFNLDRSRDFHAVLCHPGPWTAEACWEQCD